MIIVTFKQFESVVVPLATSENCTAVGCQAQTWVTQDGGRSAILPPSFP